MQPLIRLPAAGIHCRVSLAKGRGKRVLQRTGPFRNLVVTNGLANLAAYTFDQLVTYCHCGVGNQAVSIGDTNLESFLAASNNAIEQTGATQGAAPYYSEYVQTFRFAEGTFNNHQIAEVGFSDQATEGNLFSRALVEIPNRFRDPTTMLVKSTEWLDVTYEFRLYAPFVNADGSAADGTGTLVFNGESYAYTIRPANVTNIAYWSAQKAKAVFVAVSSAYATPYGPASVLGLVSNAPSSPSGDVAYDPSSSIFAEAYTPGSFNRNIVLQIGPDDCNATGGIGALRFNTGFGSYQIAFDPVLPKASSNSLNFVVNLAWVNADI